MTIDERLEALTTVLQEISTATRENQREIKVMTNSLNTLVETSARHAQDIRYDGEAINRLAHIAEMHERRLTDLEGGESKP